MKIFYQLLKSFGNRKGSSTMEYVTLLTVGFLVANLIVGVMTSQPVQEALKQAIACKFDAVDEDGNRICKDPKYAGSDFESDTGKPNEDFSPSDLKTNTQATSSIEKPTNEEKGFFEQLGDDFGHALDKAKQGIQQFVNDPWGKTKEVASDVWDGITEAASEAWEWAKENKEYIAAGVTIAAGVVLCFVAPPFGAGILIGAAVGGGISAAQGNDLKTIMADIAIGGIGGAVGGGVAGGVARGAVRYVGQKAAQLFGNSAGSAAASLADNFLRGEKFNWKNAAVAALLGFTFTYGFHAAQKAPVFGITPAQQAASQTAKSSFRYKPVEYHGTVKVNGQVRDVSRRVYQRQDIDWNAVDPETGLTNLELAKQGRAPIGPDGMPMELHHVIQKEPGPMVEIYESTHGEYHKTLHGLVEDGMSFRNNQVLNKQYNNFRKKYWRWRAKQVESEGGN